MILVAVYSVLLKFWTCGPEQCTAKVRLANDALLFFSVWQRSWLHPDLILTSSRRHAALRSRRSAKSQGSWDKVWMPRNLMATVEEKLEGHFDTK
uniref:Secreted protein n=1 Tax=Coccidioides posadasii RMSCC 3488 TaxID=454284 RepID=A0A0J6I2I8_COCPO|nr:hypothetical protein CPAG_01896 [Coccidioides posadasii RMSCC 3488]